MRIYLIVSLLLLSLGLSAQITTNTNFAVNSNQPIDTRDTLTTLADTANVDWKYPGLLSYVKDIGQYYYYDNYWKPFNSSSFLFVHVGAYEENYSLPIDTLKKYNRFYITLYAGTSAELTLPSLSGTNLTGKYIEVRYSAGSSSKIVVKSTSNIYKYNCSGYGVTEGPILADTLTSNLKDVVRYDIYGTTYTRYCTPINVVDATPADTASFIVYAPSHGLTDSIALYGYVPVKTDYTKANSSSIDSVHFAYAVGAPTTDSLELKLSGVLSFAHSLTQGALYYLQDDGTEDTTPGTVRAPTVIVLDASTLILSEVGADEDQVISRQAIPSPVITLLGGDPQNPSDTVVQIAVSTIFKPAGLAKPGTIFFTSYTTQSKNPTYQENSPTDKPISPAFSWLWDGNVVTRLSYLLTSVDLQATSAGLFILDTVQLVNGIPTDSTVANWLDSNYVNNDLRLPNGALLYWKGEGTYQNPDYTWTVIDDITNTTETNQYKRIVKKVNTVKKVFNITTIPDTLNLLPASGDAFINSSKDTLGLYSGAGWVLFFGGDNADGNGIFDSDGTIAPDDDFFIKIPNDSVFAIGSSTKNGLVDYWFTGGSSDYFRGFFYDPYVNNQLGFGDIRGDGTQMTFHVDRDRYSRMEARSSTNVGGSIQIGTNNATTVLDRGRLSFNGTNTSSTTYVLRFPNTPNVGSQLWVQSGSGVTVNGSWIDVDAVGTWLQPELEAGDVTIDGTGNLLDITTQKTSLTGDSLGLDFLNFSLSDDPETGLYAGSFDPGWSFNINNNEFNIQAGDSATLGYSVGISTLGSNQMNVYGTNGTNTYNYTLPTTSPSTGQVLGYSGAPYNELQWVTVSSSSPDSADFTTTYALADTASTLRSDLANQTLSWNPSTGELSLSPSGNTVDIDDRYLQGVTTDATLTGDGSIVSPLVVDTTEIATQYDLAQSVDSTRLTQDSILIYYQGGVEVGRDTISVAGSGGGGVTGSGASPRIAYWSGTSTLTSNSGFAWDPALSNLIANSGSASLTGGSNALVGSSAGLSVTTGSNNNFFGQSAGSGVTTGSNNNYFGTSAGANNLSGTGNNFFGTSSGISSTSSNSNFFGTNTGRVTTGNNNNFLGNNCGYSNTSGSVNFFSGNSAGYYNTTGSNNVFIGNQTGNRTTTGSENIAISTSALLSNTTGSYNISIGSGTLNGGAALGPLTGNIAIGYEAGDNVVSGADRNIAIGYRVDLPVAGNDNQITIGNLIFGTGASGTGTTAAGKMGILQPAPQYTIDINATDGARIPVGTTAQQPTGANGVIRYNSTTSAFEGYSNAAYRAFYQESTADPTSILGYVSTGLAGDITVGERLSLSSGQLDVSQRWANMRKASANVYAFSTTPEQIDTLDGSSSGGLFSIGATGVATYSNTANRVYQISWQVTFSSDTADKEVTFKVYEAGTGSDYNQATQYTATADKKYTLSGVYNHTMNNGDTIDIRGFLDSGTANITIHNISLVLTEM